MARELDPIDQRLFELSAYADELLRFIRDEAMKDGRADIADMADVLRVDIRNEITVSVLELQMYYIKKAHAIGA